MINSDSDYLFLELKPSTIPNTGIGVFVTKDIEKDVIIAEYRGAVTTLDDKIIQTNDKCIFINNINLIIVGNNCVASFINDAIYFKGSYSNKELEEIKKNKRFPLHKDKEYNCKFVQVDNKVFVISIKPIKKGEELFCDYGFVFWFLRINK